MNLISEVDLSLEEAVEIMKMLEIFVRRPEKKLLKPPLITVTRLFIKSIKIFALTFS